MRCDEWNTFTTALKIEGIFGFVEKVDETNGTFQLKYGKEVF